METGSTGMLLGALGGKLGALGCYWEHWKGELGALGRYWEYWGCN